MITLEVCHQILNKRKKQFTNEQVKQIRDYLYEIAKLQIEDENKQTKTEAE